MFINDRHFQKYGQQLLCTCNNNLPYKDICVCICTLGYHKYITYGLRGKQTIYVPQ